MAVYMTGSLYNCGKKNGKIIYFGSLMARSFKLQMYATSSRSENSFDFSDSQNV